MLTKTQKKWVENHLVDLVTLYERGAGSIITSTNERASLVDRVEHMAADAGKLAGDGDWDWVIGQIVKKCDSNHLYQILTDIYIERRGMSLSAARAGSGCSDLKRKALTKNARKPRS